MDLRGCYHKVKIGWTIILDGMKTVENAMVFSYAVTWDCL